MMGMVSWSPEEGFSMAPARTESGVPVGFRVAQYPDGYLELQAAYSWIQGLDGGITWKAIPLVQVDENGVEIKDE